MRNHTHNIQNAIVPLWVKTALQQKLNRELSKKYFGLLNIGYKLEPTIGVLTPTLSFGHKPAPLHEIRTSQQAKHHHSIQASFNFIPSQLRKDVESPNNILRSSHGDKPIHDPQKSVGISSQKTIYSIVPLWVQIAFWRKLSRELSSQYRPLHIANRTNQTIFIHKLDSLKPHIHWDKSQASTPHYYIKILKPNHTNSPPN